MYARRIAVLWGIAGMLLGAILVYPATSNAAQCGGQHRLQILDLDMAPDPITEGQPLQRWNVRLRVDASGECDTILTVKEANPPHDVVGIRVAETLKPGTNNLSFRPDAGYKFQRQDTCFIVTADIAGSSKVVDSTRKFCARFIPPTGPARWSLK